MVLNMDQQLKTFIKLDPKNMHITISPPLSQPHYFGVMNLTLTDQNPYYPLQSSYPITLLITRPYVPPNQLKPKKPVSPKPTPPSEEPRNKSAQPIISYNNQTLTTFKLKNSSTFSVSAVTMNAQGLVAIKFTEPIRGNNLTN
jgi:hypothetical protein